jgi:hypothetical protein
MGTRYEENYVVVLAVTALVVVTVTTEPVEVVVKVLPAELVVVITTTVTPPAVGFALRALMPDSRAAI